MQSDNGGALFASVEPANDIVTVDSSILLTPPSLVKSVWRCSGEVAQLRLVALLRLDERGGELADLPDDQRAAEGKEHFDGQLTAEHNGRGAGANDEGEEDCDQG